MNEESDEEDLKYLSEGTIDHLNHQQKALFIEFWTEYIRYLHQKGKNPKKNEGYAESSIPSIARRVFQVQQFVWENETLTTKLTPEYADKFIQVLNQDLFTQSDGEPYSECSKRKFVDAVKTYFRFRGTDWTPEIEFHDNPSDEGADEFTKTERDELFTAASEYQSPPTYKNVSPEERDRWNAKLAQYLGKPKAKIGPDDWEELRQFWKFSSLISVALDCGSRAGMIERLEMWQIDLDAGTLTTPPQKAIKNDLRWENELSDRSITCLKYWFRQRENRPKYDDTDHIWLNRQNNSYNSHTLNDLLRNLMAQAGIEPNGRKLSWHSIRHSTGCYLYNKYNDLTIVAETLRQSTLEAARRYAHPTRETKKEAVESLQEDEW